MLRLFIAVTISPEGLRGCAEECQRLEQAMGKLARSVRFPRPEGLHFTLKFLGWVPEERVDALREGLGRAAQGVAPFEVALGGFEAFPNAHRPRVVYIGVRKGGPELVALAERVEQQIVPLGFPAEARAFTPHVTLLRVKEPKSAGRIGEAISTLEARAQVAFAVETVVLMRSELNPGGSIYTPVETRKLGVSSG